MSHLIPSLKENKTFFSEVKETLLAFRSLPDSINNVMLIAEIGSLVILSDSSLADFISKSSKLNAASSLLMAKETMVVELITIITLQLWLNVSFFRLTYLKYFSQFDHRIAVTYPIAILAIIPMIIDFLKTTTSLVSFRNKWSEKYNQMKLLGYIANIGAVAALTYRSLPAAISMTVVFLICYVLRVSFEMVNEQTQLLMEIIHICGFSICLLNSIKLYQPDFSIYYGLLIVCILLLLNSWVKRHIFKWRISQNLPDLEELYRKGTFAETVRRITIYLCQHYFEVEQAHKLKEFLNRSSRRQLPPLTSQTKIQYVQALYALATQGQERYKDDISYLILMAQLEVAANDNIVGLIKVIHEIELKLEPSIRSWIVRIEIYRLKEFLIYNIENYKSLYRRHHMAETTIEGFFRNSSFVKTLVEAGSSYAAMWEGLIDGLFMPNDLTKKLDSLLDASKKVKESYDRIKKYNSKYSAWLYCNYLHLVSKDTLLLKEVLLDLQCLKSKVPDFMPYQNTMFLCVTLEGEIIQIGQNCLGLLGYKKQELEGESVLKLVPKFCHSKHTKWMQDYVNLRVNHGGIKSLVRWHKSSVCADSREKLRRVKLQVNLYLIHGEIRLAGAFSLSPNIKHIITFKGNGEIISVGQFGGDCETKYLYEELDVDMDEIIRQLLNGEKVRLKLLIDTEIVADEYVLMKMIDHEDQTERIYIVEGVGDSQEYEDKHMLTMNKNSHTAPQGENKEQFFDQLQQVKNQYVNKKYSVLNSIGKGFALFVFTLLCMGIAIYADKANAERHDQKRSLSSIIKTFEINSLNIVSIAGRTFYTEFILARGVMFPALNLVPIPMLLDNINSVRESFSTLGLISQPLLTEYQQNYTMQAVSLLITETIVQVFDWMLMDVLNYSPGLRFIRLVQYTANNTETLLLQLLPLCEDQMMDRANNFSLRFERIYIGQLVALIILAVASGVAILGFNYSYKSESCDVTTTILALQNQDLTAQIRKIKTFRNLIQGINSTAEEQSPQIKIEQNLSMNYSSVQGSNLHSMNNSGMVTVTEFINPNLNKTLTAKANLDPSQYEVIKKAKIRDRGPVRRNCVLFVIVFVLCVGICVNAGLHYAFSRNPHYPMINYMSSIIALKRTFYSWEVMFTSLLLNIQLNNTKLDLFAEAIQNFTYSTNQLTNYEPSLFQLPQFESFRDIKSDLDYGIICSYIDCKAYNPELNVTYYASIVDSSNAILNIYDAMREKNITLQDLLLPEYNMDYLVYADQVYMDIINRTLTVAFENLNAHINIVESEAYTRIIIQYSLISALLLVCCFELVSFARTRRRTIDILDLFKGRGKKYNND